jgi:hypothetical protein
MPQVGGVLDNSALMPGLGGGGFGVNIADQSRIMLQEEEKQSSVQGIDLLGSPTNILMGS